MTNLEIIKYLANNNPTRLAELLDDIYCNAWICGSYAGSNGEGKILEECEIDDFGEWINQEANTNFFFENELEEWSKAINPTPTITAYYDNLTVTIPIKDSANHMWNNNNEYDYTNVKEGQWIIPANHIVTGTVEGHKIECTNTLGDCGVIYIGGNAKCPHCGESYYTIEESLSTCVYYPPIIKDGVNINPDRNTTTQYCRCLNCNERFTI